MFLENPILMILLNEDDKKFYPAIANDTTIGVGVIGTSHEKFSHIFRGKVKTYLHQGVDTFDEAKEMVLTVLRDELNVGDRVCVSGYMPWNGRTRPSMDVFMEYINKEWQLVTNENGNAKQQ